MGGIIKKNDITLIAQWVKDTWNEILYEIIIKSFKNCCISNELDGKDAIFESENDDEDCSSDCNDTEFEIENM